MLLFMLDSVKIRYQNLRVARAFITKNWDI